MKKLIPLAAILLFPFIASAQKFKLSPFKFSFNVADQIIIEQDSTKPMMNAQWVLLYTPSGKLEILSDFFVDATKPFISLNEKGYYTFYYQGNRKMTDSAITVYRNYLQENESPESIQLTVHSDIADSNAQFYRQYSEKIIFYTNRTTQPAAFPVMDFEIMPSTSLYEMAPESAEKIRFTVLYKNQPVKNALITVKHINAKNKISYQKMLTDENGFFKSKIHWDGHYVITAVLRIKKEPNTQPVYDIFTTRFVFGFPKGNFFRK